MLFNTKVFILLALLGAAIAQDYDGNYGGGDYQGGQEDDFGFGGFDDDDGFAAAAAGSAPKPGRGRAAAPSYPGPEGGSNFEAGSPYEGASPDAGAGGQDFSSVLREGGSPFGSASNAKPKMAPRQKRSVASPVLKRSRRSHGHGHVGPVYTYVKTHGHGEFKWGVRHHVGKHHG